MNNPLPDNEYKSQYDLLFLVFSIDKSIAQCIYLPPVLRERLAIV